MRHQYSRRKLNLSSDHRRALLRNQTISLITYGYLVTTKAKAQEVRKLAEKIVTLARQGKDFNIRRRIKSILPYKADVISKLVDEIGPRYLNRQGGYTRLISMGRRISDTAEIARLEWVI